jgi:hypothetical protein
MPMEGVALSLVVRISGEQFFTYSRTFYEFWHIVLLSYSVDMSL